MTVLLKAHRVETTLTQNGTLTLNHLPFQAGETVEVIVLPNAVQSLSSDPYSLRGTAIHYQEPLEPVAEQDWEFGAVRHFSVASK